MGTGVALPLLSPGKKVAVLCVLAVATIGVFPSRALLDLFQEVGGSIGAAAAHREDSPGNNRGLGRFGSRCVRVLKVERQRRGRMWLAPLRGPRGTFWAAQDGGSWRIGGSASGCKPR